MSDHDNSEYVFIANLNEAARLARGFIHSAESAKKAVEKGTKIDKADVRWSEKALKAMQVAWEKAF